MKHTCIAPRNDLSPEDVRGRLDYDPISGRLMNKRGQPVGWAHSTGYVYVTIKRVAYKAHRVIWLLVYGVWPEGQIDHINGDRSDNRIENLRVVTPRENQLNKRLSKHNTSGFRGVWFRRDLGKFEAGFRVGGKRRYLGCFDSAEEASAAYEAARKG